MKQRFLFFTLMLFIAVGVIAAPADLRKKHHRPHGSAKKTLAIKVTKAGEVVLTEDFSKFTDGSETTPSTVNIFDEDNYISNDLTNTPDWWGYGVYQAGGKAFLSVEEYEDGEEVIEETGYLESSLLEFNEETNINVSIKIKSNNTQGDNFYVEWYDYETEIDGYNSVEITNDWAGYNISLPNVVGTYVYLVFYAYEFECFIDDIEVTTEEGTGGGGGGGDGNAFFFEDCGTTAPSGNPYANPATYTGWRNYGVDNITFGGSNTDVRNKNGSPQVWFTGNPGTQPCVFEISGINTSDYKDIKLSFNLMAGGGKGDVAKTYFSVKAVVGSTDYPITIPDGSIGSSEFTAMDNLTGVPSAESVKLVFTSNTAPNGFRLDDISLSGTSDGSVANETIIADNSKPLFFISGNSLSVRNVKLSSTVEIYNVAGQQLKTTKYFGGGSIHIGNLPKGVYIIRVDGFSAKIVK